MVRSGQSTTSWLKILAYYLAVYLPWFLTTPIVFWWVDRYPFATASSRGILPRRLARYFIFLSLWLACYLPVQAMIASYAQHGSLAHFPQAFQSIPLNNWVLDTVFLCALFGVATAVHFSRTGRRQERESAKLAVENAELSARLSDARLQMLQAQLEPHFLFNALNSIAALIRCAEPEAAVESVGLLSELLRYATRATTSERVTLSEEIDFAEAYLGFQQLRYGSRLRFTFSVDKSLGSVSVPPLILQPLLENAIRHGVETLEEPSEVLLSATFHEGEIDLKVRNSPGAPQGGASGLGIGLTNTRERLQWIYGRPIDLHIQGTEDGFEARLLLPLELPP